MSFGIRPLVVGDSILAYYPYPDPFHNIAIQITKYMQETLLPLGFHQYVHIGDVSLWVASRLIDYF
jgi:hypothetical protein